MVENLDELRVKRLADARCPECGGRTDVSKMGPSWCWTCRADNCTAGGMWYSDRRSAEDNLLERAYDYEDVT